MSKILGGGKLELSRGFADLNCKDTEQFFMSISTEREVIMKRLNKSLLVLRNKQKHSKGQVNAARSECTQCNERLNSLNKKVQKLADLQSLIVSRIKQSIDPEDWRCIVTLAKKDQEEIITNISGW